MEWSLFTYEVIFQIVTVQAAVARHGTHGQAVLLQSTGNIFSVQGSIIAGVQSCSKIHCIWGFLRCRKAQMLQGCSVPCPSYQHLLIPILE